MLTRPDHFLTYLSRHLVMAPWNPVRHHRTNNRPFAHLSIPQQLSTCPVGSSGVCLCRINLNIRAVSESLEQLCGCFDGGKFGLGRGYSAGGCSQSPPRVLNMEQVWVPEPYLEWC